MRIAFVSNYFNHHQAPVSNAFYNSENVLYKFISTVPMEDERIKQGWKSDYDNNFLIYSYKGKGENEAREVIENYDVVIAGSADESLLHNRIKSGKLIFRYSERPLKEGFSILKYLPRYFKWHHKNPKGKPIYLLCSSAYASLDYQRFGLFKNCAYKWGYFPECKRYSNINNLIDQKDVTEILWCGRFLDWKHPDDVIKAAKMLKDNGYSFHVKFIGLGEMDDALHRMAKEQGLNENISFLPAVPPDKVRQHMERAGIYLMTSDFKEGWGAVLNEAMNSACAVVASHAAGAAPYLVNDKDNGLIYTSSNVTELYEKIKYLLDSPDEQKRLGKSAYKTITEEWNEETAVKRFIKLSESILSGNKYPDLYKTGPCSKAQIINEDWNR